MTVCGAMQEEEEMGSSRQKKMRKKRGWQVEGGKRGERGEKRVGEGVGSGGGEKKQEEEEVLVVVVVVVVVVVERRRRRRRRWRWTCRRGQNERELPELGQERRWTYIGTKKRSFVENN